MAEACLPGALLAAGERKGLGKIFSGPDAQLDLAHGFVQLLEVLPVHQEILGVGEVGRGGGERGGEGVRDGGDFVCWEAGGGQGVA